MSNSLTFPILRVLADGKFHSGEALAQQFNVTRTTIWSAVQHAENLGVKIFSVRGRGYKLPNAVHLLEREPILQAIGEHRAWFKLEMHDHLESTNTYLMKRASSGAAHATCVVAQLQTQGKGRRGRIWQTHLGSGLTFSLLWRFQAGALALSGLSLAVGVAMMRGLQSLGLQEGRLKWPNDILVNGKKLAGTLIELQGDMEGQSAAVIGIGLNLQLHEDARREIDQAVTDLNSELSQTVSPSLVLGVLLKHLADILRVFEQHGLEPLRSEWERWHYFQGKTVRMLMPDGREIEGSAHGLAPDGALLLQTSAGIERFSSGEVSMRGGH